MNLIFNALIVKKKEYLHVNLENQVCSLELSKRLKELGVKQESLVYWLNVQHCVHMKVKENGWEVETDENGNNIIDKIDYRIELGNPFAWNIDKDNCWSAFTVSELSEMLPENTNIFMLKVKDITPTWFCEAGECNGETTNWEQTSDVIQANAIAKMIIYLLENKLMELPNK